MKVSDEGNYPLDGGTALNWGQALENSVELVEHFCHGAVDPAERLVDEDTFAERYKAGELGLHLHASIRVHARSEVGHFEIRKFCADMNRLVPARPEIRTNDPATGRLIYHSAPEVGGEQQHRMDVPVFIDVRELREEGERMVSRPIPSVVRLVPPDDCLMYIAGSQDPASGKFGLVLRERLSDGELHLSLLLGGEVRLRTTLDEYPRNVVQDRPEIVQRIPDDRAGERIERLDLSHDDGDPIRLTVGLRHGFEWITLSVDNLVGCSLLAYDVFPRPIQLRPSAFKVGSFHAT